MEKFDPAKIEDKWQKKWAKDKLFRVDIKNAKKPFFNLMMFPYPSGEGLHVGHVYAFGGSDTFGRFQRFKGWSVFEPMGFDSFGIHSENYAISKNIHPATLIKNTTDYFREKQLKKLGCLFDWNHQVITSDSDYYRWTQWIFVKLFKAGLAIRKRGAVLWCPKCLTVLAYEQVIAGKCERCETAVIQKELEQWFFKITNYADRLLKNLDYIDWSESTKQMQRNWIGRSEGVQIEFKVHPPASPGEAWRAGSLKFKINVFTTRADTIFGATFIVLAIDNPLVIKITDAKYLREVKRFIKTAKEQIDRKVAPDQKIGEFLGSYCINPLTKKPIPIYVANYVLGGYGTGAIMGVPAHDSRDYEFAKKYHLDIVKVIEPLVEKKEISTNDVYEGEGKLINSGKFTDLSSQEARYKISEYIEVNHQGNRKVNYHLRDWLISRQRYWGPPIPIIYCRKCWEVKSQKSKVKSEEGKDFAIIDGVNHAIVVVPEEDLPVLLPDVKDFQPKGTGQSPLAQIKEWVRVSCPDCGLPARRETDVSDTFLDSSWYYLRYPSVRSARSGQAPFDPDLTRKWLPVDMYIGGNEHAVLHLLYTRFVTMALADLGYLNFEEPFKKFRAHGLIIHQGAKMSKSRGNVINPNFYIEKYGSDTLRMYLLFIGPFDQGGDFSDQGIVGIWRFVNKIWRLVTEADSVTDSSQTKPRYRDNRNLKIMHQTIKKVTIDLEGLNFNTAIAALMEWLNFLQERVNKKLEISREEIETFLILLAPLAPHLTEELWSKIGNKYSIHNQKWPRFNEEYLKEDKVIVVIQVDGKVRDKVEIEGKLDKEMITRLALDRERIKRYIKEKAKNYIYVEGKLLNIVTK